MKNLNIKLSRSWKVAVILVLSIIMFYGLLYFNESAIIEQIFGDELSHGYMAKTYFLKQSQFIRPSKWFGGDIDDNILNYLKAEYSGKGLTLKKASESFFIRDTSGKVFSAFLKTGYYDKSTNERGSMLSVGPIRWLSPIKVEVDVGWYFGMLSSSSCTAILTFNGRRWIVKEYINGVIS